jgi:hypothetical protein
MLVSLALGSCLSVGLFVFSHLQIKSQPLGSVSKQRARKAFLVALPLVRMSRTSYLQVENMGIGIGIPRQLSAVAQKHEKIIHELQRCCVPDEFCRNASKSFRYIFTMGGKTSRRKSKRAIYFLGSVEDQHVLAHQHVLGRKAKQKDSG